MRQVLVALTLICVITAPIQGQTEEQRPIEAEDYYRVKRVSGSELSPDGRYLLYTVETVRRAQNDRLTEVWWSDLQTGKNQRLSTAGVNTTNPHWTPDGRRIYFTTQRGNDRGIHFLNFLEPGGEAYRIPGVPGNPIFAPDGTWILFTRQVAAGGEDEPSREPGERGERSRQGRPTIPDGIPALTRRMGTEWAGTTEEERNRDVYVIAHSTYKRDGRLEFAPAGPRRGDDEDPERYTQFFRMPADGLAEGEEGRQLTFDEWSKSFQSFSSDGRQIIYTVNLNQKDEVDESIPFRDRPMPEIGIYVIPIDGGEAREIYRDRGQLSGVRLSPDGGMIAYTITEDRQNDALVRVVSSDGEKVADIGTDWVYGFRGLTWSGDGRYLIASSQIGGQTQVVRMAATGGPVEKVTSGRHSLSGLSFDRSMTKMAYVKNTAERPWEVFVSDTDGSDERQVSKINADWLAGVKLSRVERFTFEGARHNRKWLDTLPDRGVPYMMTHEARSGERPTIEAWLMYPLDYTEGRKYPLVISIHGGPHSLYSETWFPEFQMLAAQGMFVLYINPRGSGGYGRHFSNMIMEAWGIDDYKDYMQAVDIVIERGIVDESSLGVTGGSYGGFMTNWITAHNDRFKAAITARSICNWLTFYGVSDASGLVESEFGGKPWPFESEKEGSYRLAMMLSPIVWADQVKTPTLIIHSINDYRTPLADGESWFRALKKYEVPVKMVLFPDSYHGLSRTGEPWLLVRRLNEYIDWFKAYLVDDKPVVDADGIIQR
jgi:dipeptidyl aminopeptidase/acylaminoacyl peptidase